MPHELPKAYEPGAIETRWAEYWIREKIFHVETPDPQGLKPPSEGASGGTAEAVPSPVVPSSAAASPAVPSPYPQGTSEVGGRGRPPHTGKPVFTLLLPPPNVTGRLHMGHMFGQTQMDILVRWHRMRGFLTLWLPGTDHAGIATQMMVDRQLRSEGKSRLAMGREKFVERVWEWKRLYGGNILEQMKRLGASVDWGREYFTMDENLSRAVREVFVRLYEQGLIYRGKYIVNWCADCGTAISDLEVKHEDVAGKLYEIRYPIVEAGEGARPTPPTQYITVATTRPETMLGDTAIAVNPRDERYSHLRGKHALLPLMNRAIPIIFDELAQPEFGTGAVKVTPAHDPNDFEAGKRHNLPQIEVIDEHNKMNSNAGAYAGLDRFAARARVIADLTEQGFLVGTKDYTIALGKCDRSDTIVEPRLSEQWFVKIAPLAKKAIAAVESGEITITPDNYRQIYLNWMYNIHDWCVSRQLWWGHRIPAWTCGDCKEVIVAREAPTKCTKCGGAKLEQVTDVLDTWFSSGLLPFTTLGWPDKTRDQAVFYPTTLLITAYEILFFWVARMIMFGCHFMEGHEQDPALKKASGWGDKKNDSVPFREVYIHALVRDADRQKMSKTKGNVIDPLEIIDRFGTDATRFTLAAMAAPGTDIAFNESRTEGYRAFANKIWNAARFMFMNVERVGTGLRPVLDKSETCPHTGIAGFQAQTLEDRWILSRFNRVTGEVNEALKLYRFHEAANRIYDFFWGEFCDWYLELLKPRLMETASAETAKLACENLAGVFEASLRLLHPVMPFITEEIWHAMYDGKPPLKSIALAAYPAADEAQIDLAAETEMAVLQDLIVSVRNLRAELKVEPKVKVPIELFAQDPAIRKMIEQNRGSVERLGNVQSIQFVQESLASRPGARGTARFDVHVIYERKIDVAAECARLTKELEKIEKPLASSQARLADEGFLGKAPAHVVEGLRKQVGEMEVVRDKALAKMKELGCK
ncbi:MAG: valine--tRNA ligase [Acidobacteria bacterium]|nr:valine--tRNA ligase [Acidobacteriota bacterium]